MSSDAEDQQAENLPIRLPFLSIRSDEGEIDEQLRLFEFDFTVFCEGKINITLEEASFWSRVVIFSKEERIHGKSWVDNFFSQINVIFFAVKRTHTIVSAIVDSDSQYQR